MNEFERELWRWGLTFALATLLSYSPDVPAHAAVVSAVAATFVTITG